MKIVKRISNDMMGNIDEAREKIRTAYDLKAEHPEAAITALSELVPIAAGK